MKDIYKAHLDRLLNKIKDNVSQMLILLDKDSHLTLLLKIMDEFYNEPYTLMRYWDNIFYIFKKENSLPSAKCKTNEVDRALVKYFTSTNNLIVDVYSLLTKLEEGGQK